VTEYKDYKVVIPYYHEFIVRAKSEKEALEESHSADGRIIHRADDEAEIEVI